MSDTHTQSRGFGILGASIALVFLVWLLAGSDKGSASAPATNVSDDSRAVATDSDSGGEPEHTVAQPAEPERESVEIDTNLPAELQLEAGLRRAWRAEAENIQHELLRALMSGDSTAIEGARARAERLATETSADLVPAGTANR